MGTDINILPAGFFILILLTGIFHYVTNDITAQYITSAVMDTKKHLTSTAMLDYDEPECKENQEPDRLIHCRKEAGLVFPVTNNMNRSFSEINT